MNSKNVVRKELLRRKIQEHFSKHPKSKSVIVSLAEGDIKTLFKAEKQDNSFYITEVSTKKQEFLMEQPPPPTGVATAAGTQPPAAPNMGQAGAQQHNLAAYQQQDFSSKIGMLQSGIVPMTADNVAVAFSDLLKPGVGRDVVTLRTTIEQGSANAPPEAKRALGSFLGTLTVLGNQRAMMSAGRKRKGNVVAEKKKIVLEQEDDEDIKNASGINQSTLETPPGESQSQLPSEKPEEIMVNKSLEGHTIQHANLTVEPTGGSLTLDLLTTENPASLEWQSDGRVIFSFKGRKFLVQNGQK